MAIEIEKRARFDEPTRNRLLTRLRREGEDLGRDDKHIHFFVLADQLLKVTDNLTAGTAKISLKGARIGQGASFPETEIAIGSEDVPEAVRLLDSLGLAAERHEAHNERHNFRFQGVEIALKWSPAWGHHAEFEVLLADTADAAAQHAAAEAINAVAAALDVPLMSERELADFTAAFEAAQRARTAGADESAPAG